MSFLDFLLTVCTPLGHMVSTGSGHVCTHSVIVGYLCDQTSPSAGHSLGAFTMSKANHSTSADES